MCTYTKICMAVCSKNSKRSNLGQCRHNLPVNAICVGMLIPFLAA